MRVVTTLPAATELVCALGVDPVGVSHECDYPSRIVDRPRVTATAVDPSADGETIDAQVQAASEDGGGIYAVDGDRLAALDPDVVVTQGVCSVCAVDRVRVAEVVDERSLDARVVTTDVHSLGDLYSSVRSLGAVLDREERAEQLVEVWRDRAAAVARTVRDTATADPPRVAVLDWLAPPMVAGHWVPELVALAGGRYGLAEPGERSRPREWREIREYDPEVLIAAPCGFEPEQTVRDLADLRDRPGWDELGAVPDRAWIVDGHHLVNRPGPRLLDTLELFAGLVRPDAVDVPDAADTRRIGAVDTGPTSEPG